MSLFNSFVLTVNRYSGNWNGRNYDQTLDSTFTIQTSVQPADANDLKVLPEGKRTSSIYKIYPSSELRTTDQNTQTPQDVVVFNNENYEVVHVEPWKNLLGFYKALIVREKE